MRKVLLSLTAMLLTVGLTLAAPVRLVKFDEDKKVVTVKEGKKGEEVEKTYKLNDKTKFFDEDKEIKMEEAVKKMSGDKAVKGFDLKADGDTATEIKFMAKKKKKTENN